MYKFKESKVFDEIEWKRIEKLNLNDRAESLGSILKRIITDYTKQISIRENQVKQLKNTSNELHKKAIITNCPNDWIIYKTVKNN